MIIGKGYTNRFLSEAEAREIFAQGLERIAPAGKRLLVIIPDGTRSGPMPLCFRAITDLLQGKVAQLDFMIALGTHIPMDKGHICKHVGISPEELETRYADVHIYNHNWLAGLREIGTIPAARMREISGGLMEEDVPVRISERLYDYDHILVVGPVFPHEIVGFSGGNKYFYPGVAGPEIIDATHWLGALIGCPNIIGYQDTPTRHIIDIAAAMIDLPKSCFSMVVKGHDDLAGLYFGSPEESQAAAAELSAKVNIVYLERTYKTVLSVMPELYDDIWTASKGMYKLEPVVEDDGTLIIYAPHIDEISYTHGAVLDKIGYHVCAYFLAQPERFADVPRAVMAHSALVKGAGTYEGGVEKPRIHVVLATRIPEERCRRVNLDYMDPESIDIEEWMRRQDPDTLVVPRAGELLHRLASERK